MRINSYRTEDYGDKRKHLRYKEAIIEMRTIECGSCNGGEDYGGSHNLGEGCKGGSHIGGDDYGGEKEATLEVRAMEGGKKP